MYSGGVIEPHPDNFCPLSYSDDNGKTWSKPVFVNYSSKEHEVQTVDLQPIALDNGKLLLCFSQRNYKKSSAFNTTNYGCYFYDFIMSAWQIVIENPDDKDGNFIYSEPKLIGHGLMRNKPITLKSGKIINFNYITDTPVYTISYSDDNGKTYKELPLCEKIKPMVFDEIMGYQMQDGTVRLFIRTQEGCIYETFSYDDGATWTKATKTDIKNPDSRFYIGRTPSGKILLVNNDEEKDRTNLSVYLSDDDGKTFKYKKVIDSRPWVSYPDVDFHDGKIYLVYDRERHSEMSYEEEGGAREVILRIFTEEDIIKEDFNPELIVISKP